MQTDIMHDLYMEAIIIRTRVVQLMTTMLMIMLQQFKHNDGFLNLCMRLSKLSELKTIACTLDIVLSLIRWGKHVIMSK